ncbi:MAG: CocE/NonD family hydrolase [Acidobacteria bacterium]|nr:CocE/NonD family hydrolase [Acidobacteriota bacterium]
MKTDKTFKLSLLIGLFALCASSLRPSPSAQSAQGGFDVKTHYAKSEHLIPMRDGVKLFTSIYAPKDTSRKYPIMLNRTPYSVAPYGPDAYRSAIGPSVQMAEEGYIIVYQDVRGRLMSEGEFVDARPYNPKKKGPAEVDESSDTYDAIEWLLKNIPNHNGRVGMWGISYPGFYASMGIIDAHPALKAASPQAPIGDWFIGDDWHHHGAFFLVDAFNFYAVIGQPRPKPTSVGPRGFEHGTPDGYKFFLEMGPLANANKKYFKNEIVFWNDLMKHGVYDDFWKARRVMPHLTNIKPAVLVVAGWFDAEDLYGTLNTYQAIEKQNPKAYNILAMGPWCHGCWAGGDGSSLGNIQFDSKTGPYYRENIEKVFFDYYLKDKGELKLPEASTFLTGANVWKSYDQWPPKGLQERALYFHANGKLSFDPPAAGGEAFDEYLSDPQKPVPYVPEISSRRGVVTYMVEDQRFAAMRPDVLVYESDALTEDVILAGSITAELYVSTTGSDADFVVKLIDVYPDNAPDNEPNPRNVRMGGFQMMVRGDVMRAKFRNSYERPEPMKPNQPTKVAFVLQDIHHAFRKGHKIMVQVQSSWFPLADRNPQKFVDIYNATAADFQKATQRVYRSGRLSSHLKVGVMK